MKQEKPIIGDINMEALNQPTPFQLIAPFEESFKPLWDIPAKVISTFVKIPFSLIGLAFSQFQSPDNSPIKKVPKCAEGHTLLGSLPEVMDMGKEVMTLLVSYNKKYGKEDGVCKLTIGGKTLYIVSNLELAKLILKDNESFKRGESLRVWREFSPGGLSEGKATQDYRTKAIRFIGPKNLPRYFNGMLDIAKQWTERLVNKGTFELFHEGERVALGAMGETFFMEACNGNPFGLTSKDDILCEVFLKSFKEVFAIMTTRFTSGVSSINYIGDFLYGRMYPEDNQQIQTCKAVLSAILYPIFDKAFDNPAGPTPQAKKIFEDFGIDPKITNFKDIIDNHPNKNGLAKEYEEQFKENPPQSFSELKRAPKLYKIIMDDIILKSLGFLHGSFGTSSKAIAWILYLLGKNPTFQQRLNTELKAAFPNGLPICKEDLEKVPLLFQIIEEALRLYSPFPFLVRDIEDPTKFDAFEVEKNGTFVLSPYLMGHDEKIWQNPEEFNPDRFSLEMLKEDNFAFLDGPHRCPGRFFVKQEIALVLATLFSSYKVELEDPTIVPEMKFNITLHSKNPVNARLVGV
jgi:cytochrome P450